MNAEKLKALAAQGTRAFLAAAPRVALGGLTGAFIGLLSMGALGTALAFCSAGLWHENDDIPSWLRASAFVMPLILALAGVFVGAVRGLLAALATQLVEKKLLAYVYAQVKPAVTLALKRASGADPAKLAAELQAQLTHSAGEETAKAESYADQLAQWVTLRSRRVLALSLVAHVARAKTGQEAAAELEKLGVAKLEAILVGALEDLFSVKLTLIAGGALVLSFAPQVVWQLTR